jgi:hypothetical protein
MKQLWALAVLLGLVIAVARIIDEDFTRRVLEMLITGARP